MLREDAVAGEHTEEALKVLGIAAAGGEEATKDLGGGEGGVRAVLPDGVWDFEADDGVERHGYAEHVGHLHDC